MSYTLSIAVGTWVLLGLIGGAMLIRRMRSELSPKGIFWPTNILLGPLAFLLVIVQPKPTSTSMSIAQTKSYVPTRLKGFEDLLDAVNNTSSDLFSYEAAERLGQMRDPRAIEALTNAAKNGRSDPIMLPGKVGYVPVAATEALGMIGGKDAIASLRELLSSPIGGVQFAAKDALAKLGIKAEIENWQAAYVTSDGCVTGFGYGPPRDKAGLVKVEFLNKADAAGYLYFAGCRISDGTTGRALDLSPVQKRAVSKHFTEDYGSQHKWQRASQDVKRLFITGEEDFKRALRVEAERTRGEKKSPFKTCPNCGKKVRLVDNKCWNCHSKVY